MTEKYSNQAHICLVTRHFCQLKKPLFLKICTKIISALLSNTEQTFHVTLNHLLCLRSDAHRQRRHPNNVGERRSEICPVTANKMLTTTMNLLASASSTGMQASDSGSQSQSQEPLLVQSILQRGTNYLGKQLFCN